MSDDGPTIEERIEDLRRDYDSAQRDISMDDVTRELGDVATRIAELPARIERLRERGYAFASYLERKAEVLDEQWQDIRRQVRSAIDTEIDRVQREFDQVRDLWYRLEGAYSDRAKEELMDQIQHGVREVEQAARSARSRITGMFGQVPANVDQTVNQLDQINTYLDHFDASTVDWRPTEAIFMANEAEWVKTGKGKNDPDGILFITDQRLVFEQNEKVGGRLGFGGEQVQDLLFEAPLNTIAEATAEKKGLFGGKDMVYLTLDSGSYSDITLEVKGGVNATWYVQQINRAATGEIDKERAIPVDESAADMVANAPTQCTTCGAVLPSITRGMTEIACEYCGTVVRL